MSRFFRVLNFLLAPFIRPLSLASDQLLMLHFTEHQRKLQPTVLYYVHKLRPITFNLAEINPSFRYCIVSRFLCHLSL